MIVTLLLLLIFLNGLLSMAETAVIASRKARLQQAAEHGSGNARVALKLAKHPTRFLATVQIGITSIGLLSGAIGEATIANDIQSWLRSFPAIAPYAEVISILLLVSVLTYVSLIFGELIPKRIALIYPEAIASGVAKPMKWLSRFAAPAVGLLSLSTEAILRVFGIKQHEESPVTTDELKVLIKQGADAGIFEKAEQDLFTNVFRLADRRASALMTPRKDIVWLDTSETEEQVRAKMIENAHAFFPVAQGSLDHVVGVLSAKDCLARVLNNEPIRFHEMMHKPLIVPESVSTLQMLESFRQSPSQIALISDEYGSILGVVTQNDVLESIVGDMPSPEEDVEPEVVQREDGSWLVNGSMPADELKELLRIPRLPNDNHYDTVGGFVLMQLQKIPAAADHFIWNDLRFEVMDMDGKRIDKVLIAAVVK